MHLSNQSKAKPKMLFPNAFLFCYIFTTSNNRLRKDFDVNTVITCEI